MKLFFKYTVLKMIYFHTGFWRSHSSVTERCIVVLRQFLSEFFPQTLSCLTVDTETILKMPTQIEVM
jgi:hypothetical protein